MPSITSRSLRNDRSPAVDDRRHDEEDEDQRHDAAQHRPQIVDQQRIHRRIAKPPVLRQGEQCQAAEHREQRDAGQLQPALLFLRQRLQTLFRVLQVVRRPARIKGAELGSTIRGRHQGADRGDHEVAHEHEQVVRGRLTSFAPPGAYEGSIRRAASVVIPASSGSTVPIRMFAEYPPKHGKRGRQSDQRIAADGTEHHRRQGNQDHVPHLGGGVRDHRGEHDGRRQQVAGRPEHERLSRAPSNPDRSATPTPRRATRTVPSGAKP